MVLNYLFNHLQGSTSRSHLKVPNLNESKVCTLRPTNAYEATSLTHSGMNNPSGQCTVKAIVGLILKRQHSGRCNFRLCWIPLQFFHVCF
mmetsp:Transcript_48767/g.136462  ORF Transcript_48767/g.136462 Transcript_48767/m.136462 type:complete len:90 (+) Transcript_48767:953-1222(+)